MLFFSSVLIDNITYNKKSQYRLDKCEIEAFSLVAFGF